MRGTSALSAALLLCGAVKAEQHNVLMIVSDDLRPDLGTYGGPAVTPHLDALAGSAGTVRFDRAYVQQAICCPSRTSFLLGRRPDTTKVWDLKTQFRDTPGGVNWSTLPQFFRKRGYVTAGLGKVFHPVPYEGHTDDIAGGSWSLPYYHAGKSADKGAPLSKTNCGVASEVNDDDEFSDGMVAQQAVATMRNLTSPFFLAVGFHRPHLPWIVPKKYFELYPDDKDIPLADYREAPKNYNVTGAQQWSWDPQSGPRHCQPLYNLTHPTPTLPEYGLVSDDTARHFRRSYWAAVSQTDRNVGVVLDELHALGLEDKTVIVFLGDHGWQLGDLGEFGKKTNFERATRAPLIFRDPKAFKAGTPAAATDSLVEFVDIMPTLIDLALGASAVPSVCPLDSTNTPECTEGRSLSGIMSNPGDAHAARSAVFMQYAACMHDEGVWHDGCGSPTEPRVMGYALRTRRYRYVEWVAFDKHATPPVPMWNNTLGSELYDHTDQDTVENVAEAVNLVAEETYKDVVQELAAMLRAGWRAAQ